MGVNRLEMGGGVGKNEENEILRLHPPVMFLLPYPIAFCIM